MAESIRRLCALSILCGAALSISPKGNVRRIMGIVCAAALICAVIEPIRGMDFSAYSLELAKTEQRREEFLTENADTGERLNRLVIQEQYRAYIMDKAKELDIPMSEVSLELRWSGEGLWLPESASYTAAPGGDRAALEDTVQAELGIPKEKQGWSDDE